MVRASGIFSGRTARNYINKDYQLSLFIMPHVGAEYEIKILGVTRWDKIWESNNQIFVFERNMSIFV